MILAAGLGTRLLPLTISKPKALIEINGQTLLEICINKLIASGIEEIVVNTHHFAGMLKEYLNSKNNFGVTIVISDESDQLLDSGGGIQKARQFLGNESFLVYNVDILSSIDINTMFSWHMENEALATLAVRKRSTSRYLLFDNTNCLRGWKNENNNQIKINNGYNELNLNKLAFSGIQIISTQFFDKLTLKGKFSIIEAYLQLSENEKIIAYAHDSDKWIDVGKSESLRAASKLFKD